MLRLKAQLPGSHKKLTVPPGCSRCEELLDLTCEAWMGSLGTLTAPWATVMYLHGVKHSLPTLGTLPGPCGRGEGKLSSMGPTCFGCPSVHHRPGRMAVPRGV